MDKADNYKGVEVCASDIGLSDLMIDIADLKAGIDTISEELYKIIVVRHLMLILMSKTCMRKF